MSSATTVTRPDTTLVFRSDMARGKLKFRLFCAVFMLAAGVIVLASLVTWQIPDHAGSLLFIAALFARNIGKVENGEVERLLLFWGVFAVLLFTVVVCDNWLPAGESETRGVLFAILTGVAIFGDRLFVRYRGYSWITRRISLSRFSGASTQRLQNMKESIDDGLKQLARLRVFDVDDSALAQAWEKKNVARIQELLQKGSWCNHYSSAQMVGIVNEIGERIDVARGHLARIIRQSDRVLRPYQIDDDDPRIKRSLVVAGTPEAIVTAKTLPRQFNIARGMSSSVNQVVMNVSRHNMSAGQGAAALLVTAAIAVVVHGIHNSRALRKLKDLEGQLAEQAEAIAGELRMFTTIVEAQMRPQFAALADSSVLIEYYAGQLRAADAAGAGVAAPPRAAFELKIALLEAKRLLSTRAGDS